MNEPGLNNSNPVDQDNRAVVNPYQALDLLWDTISPYFIKNYSITLSQSFPNSQVTGPVIVWNVVRRTPGGDGDSVMNKRGANFSKYVGTTPDGYINSAFTQRQTLVVEYYVYAVNMAELNEIAWDLEQAIIEATATMQSKIEGYTCTFEQQTIDSSMLYRAQDELLKKTIRFSFMIPVQYITQEKQIKDVQVNKIYGNLFQYQVFTRTDMSTGFTIPLTSTAQRVNTVKSVSLPGSGMGVSNWTPLLLKVDYFLQEDSTFNVSIQWNDDYGNTPKLGQQFRVEYTVSQIVDTKVLS